MIELKIENKLDKILKYFELKSNDNSEYDFQNIIWSKLIKEVAGTNNHFVLMLLNKLEKDGFIENQTFGNYSISVNGLLFIRNNGYTQKLIDLNLEREKIKREITSRRINDCLLIIGSITAGVGAIGLLVWEIIKYSYHLS